MRDLQKVTSQSTQTLRKFISRAFATGGITRTSQEELLDLVDSLEQKIDSAIQPESSVPVQVNRQPRHSRRTKTEALAS